MLQNKGLIITTIIVLSILLAGSIICIFKQSNTIEILSAKAKGSVDVMDVAIGTIKICNSECDRWQEMYFKEARKNSSLESKILKMENDGNR